MNTSVDMPRIAFQGERGAFSEEAAVKLLGERIALVPRPTFRALFASLDEDLADFILAPIENSIAGTVQEAYELLRQHALSVCDEVVFPIVLNLIGCPGASFGNVRTAESHPVALAQCQRFFANHPEIEAITAQDTAGSVASVIARGDQTRAAIASRRAAEVYGGVILQEHLEDQQENYTRFLLLAGTPNRERAVEQTSAARPVRDSSKVRR